MTNSIKVTNKDRQNNFGFLRLLFATLVVVSHSPELLDGNRSREILTRLFGTMSFGEVGVHGFFIISGYLITKSFVESRSTASYLTKRFLRIVPGYLFSFVFCVLVVASLVGGGPFIMSTPVLKDLFFQAITLRQPIVPGVFQGLPYPVVNGAMWTIAYEFRCYLAAALIGLLGLYTPRYRGVLLGLLVALLLLNVTRVVHGFHTVGDDITGIPQYSVEFSGIFGMGAIYYLFRDKIPLTSRGALLAAILLVTLLFNQAWAGTAFTIFGGYLIIWFAFKVRVLILSRFDNRLDISYGLYLYAWPIQNLIAWNDLTINPWLLCCMSLFGAALLGYASWMLIEQPMLRLAPRRSSGTAVLQPANQAIGSPSSTTYPTGQQVDLLPR